jgi:hypothetical protein
MSFNLARVVAVTAALSISACSTVACAPPPGDSVAQLETTMADGTAPASPATNVNDEALEACWQDVRDRAFNVEIHHMLGTAATISAPSSSRSRRIYQRVVVPRPQAEPARWEPAS